MNMANTHISPVPRFTSQDRLRTGAVFGCSTVNVSRAFPTLLCLARTSVDAWYPRYHLLRNITLDANSFGSKQILSWIGGRSDDLLILRGFTVCPWSAYPSALKHVFGPGRIIHPLDDSFRSNAVIKCEIMTERCSQRWRNEWLAESTEGVGCEKGRSETNSFSGRLQVLDMYIM